LHNSGLIPNNILAERRQRNSCAVEGAPLSKAKLTRVAHIESIVVEIADSLRRPHRRQRGQSLRRGEPSEGGADGYGTVFEITP
jgi:hypothetical protein